MAYTVFLGNLPTWVTADDIGQWLAAEGLVADSIKVIRNPETQESKGFAFIEAPNNEEMASIIKRFDRAPLEDKLLRANPAQPPKGKGAPISAPGGFNRPQGANPGGPNGANGGGISTGGAANGGARRREGRPQGSRPVAGGAGGGFGAGAGTRRPKDENRQPSAFAEELAKAL